MVTVASNQTGAYDMCEELMLHSHVSVFFMSHRSGMATPRRDGGGAASWVRARALLQCAHERVWLRRDRSTNRGANIYELWCARRDTIYCCRRVFRGIGVGVVVQRDRLRCQMSTVGHESRHKEHMAMLKEHAVRVVEILIDWDEDNNGKTDRGEFLKALPVLNISATKAEGRALFDSLSAGARQVEHWELFRRLVAAPGVDLIAAEDSARRQLAIAKTMSKTAVLSPFWQRETGGKSVNRHALRKRTVALQPWERHNKGTGNEWTSGLRSMSAFQADSEVESVNARQLQGIILNTDAPVQQQLLAALDQHLARVIGEHSPRAIVSLAKPHHNLLCCHATRIVSRVGRGWRRERHQARI